MLCIASCAHVWTVLKSACLARMTSRCRRAYVLQLWFLVSSSYFFLFFDAWCLISEITERISTKLGHIHLWLLFEKFGRNSCGHLPPTDWGQKTLFWDQLWTLTEHISAMEHGINNRNDTCQSTGTPRHAPKFCELWSRNGWERLASFFPPPWDWETLPALPHGRYKTDSRQTLAHVT